MKYVSSFNSENYFKLDSKDYKLLYLLSINARESLAQLSKAVGLSHDTISYRLNRYAEKGLVQGYTAVLTIKNLGYDNYHVFIKLSSPSAIDRIKLITLLKKLSFVRTIIEYNGKYDLELAVCARSVFDFEHSLDTILQICSSHISFYEILTLTSYYRQSVFPYSFYLPAKKKINQISLVALNNKGSTYNKSCTFDLDEKDKTIILLLSKNAREKMHVFCEKTKLSADAVSYRIKKLESAGYITAYIPTINYEQIGYSMPVVLMNIMPFTSKEQATLREFFITDDNCIWAAKTIGLFNTIFYLLTKNVKDVHSTIERLNGLFPGKIKNYETLIAYEEHKYSYLPDVVSTP